MLPSGMTPSEKRRLRNRVAAAGAILLIGWLTFFDSHSLVKRVAWYAERSELQEENARLRAEISHLEEELGKGLSDEAVERIAREEYGMRRPDETVYPVRRTD